ncbi:uncharacterized protein [Pocillopora verrucosa]|uniref:uncharacterized protein n=1 Tax=Pocillopora verrucosa TaxID=203993 RepID=UPI00333F59E2
MSGEITCKPSRGHSYSATVDVPKLVPQTTQTAGGGIHCYSAQERSVRFAGDSTTTPITGETDSLGMSFERKIFEDRGFSKKTTDIIMHSWRDSSRKQYDVHIRKWILLCSARKIDLIYTNITDALEFLAAIFDQKLSYSSINSACSTLSTILQTSSNCNYTFGEHPDVKRFMKGVYQNRPPMPRYNKTWDVNVVLQNLRGMGKATELSINELTLKLVMLIVLTTACSRLEEVNGVVFLSHLLNIFTAELSSSFFQAAKVGSIKGI